MSHDAEKDGVEQSPEVVVFSNHLLKSQAFSDLFARGMSLVEEAATYLDTRGRAQSKLLDREASLVYATESMRLTTRLMQLASWLLLQRAVSEGEMTSEQAEEEHDKIKIKKQDKTSRGDNWDFLPEELRDMIQRSLRLQEQVIHFDEALTADLEKQKQEDNPLSGHLNLIREAFQK